jgi:hypothetical protein
MGFFYATPGMRLFSMPLAFPGLARVHQGQCGFTILTTPYSLTRSQKWIIRCGWAHDACELL